MAESLVVYWDGALVGHLYLNAAGAAEFAYADPWLEAADARPISVSLPLQREAFPRSRALPFFEGILPEAAQRSGVARALGISPQNEFGLLRALGGEVAGALEIIHAHASPAAGDAPAAPQALDDGALAELLRDLPGRPFLAGATDAAHRGLRLSLAGAQPKLPVVLVDGAVALPAAGQPTTHILKPATGGLAGAVENEYFCMTLAARIGLGTAEVEYRRTPAGPFNLIRRYDRQRAADGRWTRLHQEDMCQALGLTSAHKYAVEGGPTLDRLFALLRAACNRPAVAVLRLLDAVLFNTLIGNADAHGKNFSLLYGPAGTALAPLYDLLCTVVYPQYSPRFAMKVGGARTLEEIDAQNWINLAGQARMRPAYVRRRAAEIAEAVLRESPGVLERAAGQGIDEAALQPVAQSVTERSQRLLRTLQ
jgi:serine/threonine-protein kinase HipA